LRWEILFNGICRYYERSRDFVLLNIQRLLSALAASSINGFAQIFWNNCIIVDSD